MTVPISKPKHPTQLIEQVAVWHKIGVREILSPCRTRDVVAARFDAIAAVYINCRIDRRRYSLNDLGRVFGRDHCSILQALRARGLRSGRRGRSIHATDAAAGVS